MGKIYSIIVPIYKVESYLEECISSIISQTYKDLQIILVDDGSPDNCLEICKSFSEKDRRINIVHKENGGLVSARKAGADQAKGDYIICLDGDDWIEPTYVEEIDNVLKDYNYDVVCTGFNIASDSEKKPQKLTERLGSYNKKELEIEIYPHLIQSSKATSFLPTVWAKAFRRELYITYQIKVDNRIAMGEDGACTIPLIYNADSMFIFDNPLYNYRVNENSMTKAKRSQSWSSFFAIVQYLIEAVDMSNNDISEQMNRRIARSFFNVAKSRFNDKKPYKEIKTEIITQLYQPMVFQAIKKCSFTGSIKGCVISTVLKNRWIRALWLLNKLG